MSLFSTKDLFSVTYLAGVEAENNRRRSLAVGRIEFYTACHSTASVHVFLQLNLQKDFTVCPENKCSRSIRRRRDQGAIRSSGEAGVLVPLRDANLETCSQQMASGTNSIVLPLRLQRCGPPTLANTQPAGPAGSRRCCGKQCHSSGGGRAGGRRRRHYT